MESRTFKNNHYSEFASSKARNIFQFFGFLRVDDDRLSENSITSDRAFNAQATAQLGTMWAFKCSAHSMMTCIKKAAEDIGFYYAANAAGRLAGTFLSGFLYYQGGLLACLAGSALFLIITALMVARLPQLEA